MTANELITEIKGILHTYSLFPIGDEQFWSAQEDISLHNPKEGARLEELANQLMELSGITTMHPWGTYDKRTSMKIGTKQRITKWRTAQDTEDYIAYKVLDPVVALGIEEQLGGELYSKLNAMFTRVDGLVDIGTIKMDEKAFDSLDVYFPIDSMEEFISYAKAYAEVTEYKPFIKLVESLPRKGGVVMLNVAKIAKKLLDKGETKLAREVLALNKTGETSIETYHKAPKKEFYTKVPSFELYATDYTITVIIWEGKPYGLIEPHGRGDIDIIAFEGLSSLEGAKAFADVYRKAKEAVE